MELITNLIIAFHYKHADFQQPDWLSHDQEGADLVHRLDNP